MGSVLKTANGSDWFAETVNWESSDPHSIRKIGVSKSAIQHRADRGQSWELGQLYGVLATGIISATHIFQGLRRPMSVNGDMEADKSKLIFTWVAHRDAQLSREGQISYCAAPLGAVFFVIVSPNLMIDRYPDIYGWAERWGWLEAHSTLRGAPIDFDTRYDTRLWSSQ